MNDSLLEIPGYSLHRRLGKGGMAEVYLATQNSLSRKVAVKVLQRADDESFNSRFIKEAHIVASLRHPAIITIHDIDRLADGRFYLAMEYLPGGDLARCKGQVFEPAEALSIVRQIASGLAVVHEKGLIHRDIKPANILFHEDGSVVITDFGVAKELALDSELTHSGIAVGSPSYSSPEQARCEPLDARSDIYSLGVTLLEMLTGSNPFRGATYTDTVLKHLQMEIPRLPASLAAYQELLDCMLAKDARQRFADCQALLVALDELQAGDPDSTHVGPSLFAQSGAALVVLPRRRWLGGALLAVCGLFLLGALAFAGLYLKQHLQVVDLLMLGEQRLAQGKLLEPAGDNADYFFRQALLIEDDNIQALEGLQRVLQARIELALQLAEERLEQDQLVAPTDDSAVYYFRQVLGWAPQDERALAGLQRVAQRFTDLSEAAYARQDFALALSYLEQGLEVEPENPGLLSRHQQHQQRVKAFEAARRATLAQRARPAPSKAAPPVAKQAGNPVKRLWNRIFD